MHAEHRRARRARSALPAGLREPAVLALARDDPDGSLRVSHGHRQPGRVRGHRAGTLGAARAHAAGGPRGLRLLARRQVAHSPSRASTASSTRSRAASGTTRARCSTCGSTRSTSARARSTARREARHRLLPLGQDARPVGQGRARADLLAHLRHDATRPTRRDRARARDEAAVVPRGRVQRGPPAASSCRRRSSLASDPCAPRYARLGKDPWHEMADAMIEALDRRARTPLAEVRARDLARVSLSSATTAPTNRPSIPPRPGASTGEHAKGTAYQAGIRVPLIVAGPDAVPGTCDELVSVVDLFATVAELAGGGGADGGLDLPRPLPARQPEPLRETVYTELFRPNSRATRRGLRARPRAGRHTRVVLDGRFKLVRFTDETGRRRGTPVRPRGGPLRAAQPRARLRPGGSGAADSAAGGAPRRPAGGAGRAGRFS